ncbi:sugar ABC transporter substrate-binding protein, partial [Rhizobium anhuiense]
MNRFLTTTAMIALALASGSVSVRAADVKEVQMLHWWTSGGEAAA